MKKDIIFYSNHCTYCKEVINQISKTPINDTIMYVCVDDDNIQLPPFITAVPTIYLINDKKIVVDEAISEWIKEKLSSAAGPTINDDEIQAYYGGCGDSFGQNCSFVDNSESKPYISSYTFISDDTGSTMAANDKNNPQSNNDLEKLQKMRNQEFQPINRK